MGTINTAVKTTHGYEVVEIGGHVIYSLELRLFLLGLPLDQRRRIIAEIEQPHQIRREIHYFPSPAQSAE